MAREPALEVPTKARRGGEGPAGAPHGDDGVGVDGLEADVEGLAGGLDHAGEEEGGGREGWMFDGGSGGMGGRGG